MDPPATSEGKRYSNIDANLVGTIVSGRRYKPCAPLPAGVNFTGGNATKHLVVSRRCDVAVGVVVGLHAPLDDLIARVVDGGDVAEPALQHEVVLRRSEGRPEPILVEDYAVVPPLEGVSLVRPRRCWP